MPQVLLPTRSHGAQASAGKTMNPPKMNSESQPGKRSTPATSGPALVLVVDDQPRNLQIVKKVLSGDGYHVVTADSGEEALKCMQGRRPDLILLDVVMPGMNGFEVCEQIKSNSDLQDIPVVFLSADTEHQSVMTAFSKGGVDYIPKPFNKAELLARVRTHVDLHRSRLRHDRQVEERQRTLDIIAHEWHQPLQKIFLFLSKIQDDSDATEADIKPALSKAAMKDTERMLTSLEGFLMQQPANKDAIDTQEKNSVHSSSGNGTTSGNGRTPAITTEEVKAFAGKWYVTAKRKLVELVLTAPSKPTALEAPAFAVQQIVDAVLANAVKFTPQTGRIDVKIFEENGQTVLQVEDDGPGFSEEYLERKFQPYLRPMEGRATATALGVGLAAAKRIADQIHASISLGNRPNGQGSRVRVTFAPQMEPVRRAAKSAIKKVRESAVKVD